MYILHQSATASVVIVDESAVSETIRYPVTIIRQGEDGTQDDFGGQMLVHYMQDPGTELTAQVEIYNAECK